MPRRAEFRRDRHAAQSSGRTQVTASIILLVAIVTCPPLRPAWPSDSEKPTRRNYKVCVDLSKKDTYVAIPGSAEQTRVLNIKVEELPSPYRLAPTEGIVRFGRCVDIVLTKSPNVHIRLSIVRRGDALAVRVSPLIDIGRADPVEFTHDRIKRTLWSFRRRIKDLHELVSAAQQECHRIDTWLATPGNKPFYLHKAIRLRQKLLVQQIAACQRALPAAQRRYASLREIIELAGQMHATTEVRFTVEAGRR